MNANERLMKVIEILKAPESSDEIWWAVGELETLAKDLKVEKEEDYGQGVRDTLEYLSSLYEGVYQTDLAQEFDPDNYEDPNEEEED
jgi:hypothetical protein